MWSHYDLPQGKAKPLSMYQKSDISRPIALPRMQPNCCRNIRTPIFKLGSRFFSLPDCLTQVLPLKFTVTFSFHTQLTDSQISVRDVFVKRNEIHSQIQISQADFCQRCLREERRHQNVRPVLQHPHQRSCHTSHI